MLDNHQQFLARQCAVNRHAFGPGERREGVLRHIEQEVEEVRSATTHEERAREWVDITLLGQDGLLRSVREMLREGFIANGAAEQEFLAIGTRIVAHFGEPTSDYVAEAALSMLKGKLEKNELREWDDWRVVGEDAPVNHVEGAHD